MMTLHGHLLFTLVLETPAHPIVIQNVIFCASLLSFLFSSLRVVEGSASWRIPLGVQLIPGIVLAIGSIFLPPSPRLLVAQGRNDEALRTLAKLRFRSEHEVQDDPLLQVRVFGYSRLNTSSLSCILVPGFYVIDVRFVSCRFLRFGFPPDPHLACFGCTMDDPD